MGISGGRLMLGYTVEDIYRMMAAISLANSYVPPNAVNDEVREGLHNASNFLEGLLVEGHIQ